VDDRDICILVYRLIYCISEHGHIDQFVAAMLSTGDRLGVDQFHQQTCECQVHVSGWLPGVRAGGFRVAVRV